MSRPRFTLRVVASLDGFIARRPGHAPADWASAEEQALFVAAVDAADWAVMGRGTHEAALKPDRRRIVLSSTAPRPEWRTELHLWLDPANRSPDELADLVAEIRPMREAVALGGTATHDWLHGHRRLDAVALSVEPVRFGSGLPIFGDQTTSDPVRAFTEKRYAIVAEETLNEAGTRLVTLTPRDPLDATVARRHPVRPT